VEAEPREYQQFAREGKPCVATRYADIGGWQHWLSPQIEMRPEIAYYRSLDANAFNGDANAGIAPTKNYAVIGAADLIIHF
jgi:hypothetical protein